MKMTRVLAIVLATTLLSLGEAGAQTECSILYYPWFEDTRSTSTVRA